MVVLNLQAAPLAGQNRWRRRIAGRNEGVGAGPGSGRNGDSGGGFLHHFLLDGHLLEVFGVLRVVVAVRGLLDGRRRRQEDGRNVVFGALPHFH